MKAALRRPVKLLATLAAMLALAGCENDTNSGPYPTIDAGHDSGFPTGDAGGDAAAAPDTPVVPDTPPTPDPGAVEPDPGAEEDPGGSPDPGAEPDATEPPDVTGPDPDIAADAGTLQEGTPEAPFIIPGSAPVFTDQRDTCEATSDAFDEYPPATQDETGPEYVYLLQLEQSAEVAAWIAFPEPAGVDVDIHLLSSLDPLTLIARDHYQLSAVLAPGTYYLVLDTFGGDGNCGGYQLTVELEELQPGTLAEPITPGGSLDAPLPLPFWYEDARDTNDSSSDAIDSYPPASQDESGPEYVYAFTVDQEVRLAAVLRVPEPNGVDIDVHLLSSLEPLELIERGNRSVYAILQPGTYYLVLDTWVSSGGTEMAGPYHFSLSVRERAVDDPMEFNSWILASVDYLYANYGLLGYDSAVLTHDVQYGPYGIIPMSGGQKTMCVAAVMEVILEAMNLYLADTGDASIFDYLPEESWETLYPDHIKAHIWVNYDLDSGGTADALRHFGMGDNLPFEELTPGSFINLNRTNGSGHAVVFISFIDIVGNESDTWHEGVVGFKYFSSQGGYDVGAGGFDYRYAIFDEFGSPAMPYKRDLGVIYSTSQVYLNTGVMFAPGLWDATVIPLVVERRVPVIDAFDPAYFTGWTADDARAPRCCGDSPQRLR